MGTNGNTGLRLGLGLGLGSGSGSGSGLGSGSGSGSGFRVFTASCRNRCMSAVVVLIPPVRTAANMMPSQTIHMQMNNWCRICENLYFYLAPPAHILSPTTPAAIFAHSYPFLWPTPSAVRFCTARWPFKMMNGVELAGTSANNESPRPTRSVALPAGYGHPRGAILNGKEFQIMFIFLSPGSAVVATAVIVAHSLSKACSVIAEPADVTSSGLPSPSAS